MNSSAYAVVGGGVSGIAATYFLRKQGISAELFEQEDKLGGRTRPFPMGERLVQLGGKNIGRNYPLFREFTAAMGANTYEFFGLNSSQMRKNRIITLDGTRRLKSTLEFMKHGSWQDILRFWQMCASIMLNQKNGFLGSSYFNSLGQKFDDFPVSHYFSKEFCQTVIRPMSVRMNGAEADEIYMGNLGSNLRMILDTYEQLKHGMGPVLEQFAKTGPVHLGTKVESLLVQNGSVTGLRLIDKNGNIRERQYAGVILATPAPITARLVKSHDCILANILERVRYYPVRVIVAEYSRKIFSEKVRAMVFDDNQIISNAGSYGINDRHIIRYTFSGRTARQCLETINDVEKLVCLAEEVLNRHILVQSSERVRFVSTEYSIGLCAYTPHYEDFCQSLQNQLKQLQGLFVAGDYIKGASIEACFQSAKACVDKLLSSRKVPLQAPNPDLVNV